MREDDARLSTHEFDDAVPAQEYWSEQQSFDQAEYQNEDDTARIESAVLNDLQSSSPGNEHSQYFGVDAQFWTDPELLTDLPVMSYQEVGEHNSRTSAYVIYRGVVLDITDFLAMHPGGEGVLYVSLGTDVTDTLDSFHDLSVSTRLKTQQFRDEYGISLVGKLQKAADPGNYNVGLYQYQSRRQYTQPDEFWQELRREVYAHIRRHKLNTKKGTAECIALLLLFYTSYLVTIYAGFVVGLPWLCLLLGPIATFMAVNVGHTVMHGGFSDNSVINVFGRGLGDASGYSSSCWDVEHQVHHQAPHSSIDLQTAPPSGVKFFEHQESYWHHKYQMYYMWILFIVYSPVSWVLHSYRTLMVYPSVTPFEKVHHVVFKFFGFLLPILLGFYYNDLWLATLCFMAYSLSMSYFSIFTLFIQHEESYLPENVPDSWAVRQVTTSVSWKANSRVFEWLFGYFNYHIEHHLFPGLNPSIYPKIQPVVKSICAKHGVDYKHVSYKELVQSQIKAWKTYSLTLPMNSEASVESLGTRFQRFGFNLIPAFRGTGARITYIASDYRKVRMSIPLSWRTRNYVGTIFGGSMFAAVDPVYMVMFFKILGKSQSIWVKSANIEFIKPGKGTLTAEFLLTEEETRSITDELDRNSRLVRDYTIELVDASGEICARVIQTLHFKKRN